MYEEYLETLSIEKQAIFLLKLPEIDPDFYFWLNGIFKECYDTKDINAWETFTKTGHIL